MIEPNFHQFVVQTKSFRTIPMWLTIVADTKTPIQLFQMFQDKATFLLESNDSVSPWSNYSFIGINPNYFFTEKNGKFYLVDEEGNEFVNDDDLLKAWDECLKFFSVSPMWPNVPFPGGAVGYFSFEAYALQEKSIIKEKKSVPDVQLVFCETILAYHHEKEELTIIHLQHIDENVEKSYESGREKLLSFLTMIEKGESLDDITVLSHSTIVDDDVFRDVEVNVEKETFMCNVNKIKEKIATEDLSQVVISQQFQRSFSLSGFDVYRVLRKVNPSPYLYYLRIGEMELIGSSPERQIKIDPSGLLEIHPIAGTKPRGKTADDDVRLKKELLQDEKELLEHDMLVDLAINDLKKVSVENSIFVRDEKEVVYFSHVMHLITKVYGKLKENCHPLEALLAAHPAGTVSGSPKSRAVKMIQEMEEPRGVYAGAIAYCGFNGAIDSCIAIRTIVLKNDVATVQAGAGIVMDSDPEKEYEETKNKARGLLYALKVAEVRKHERTI